MSTLWGRLRSWSAGGEVEENSSVSRAEYRSSVGESISNISNSYPALYRKLSKDRKEIRLLDIHPGIGDQPIRCTLKHSYLAERPLPSYETVSYVRGTADVRDTVWVNDIPVDAPASSVRVLRRVRHTDRDRVVWIDAICINQTDIEERGQQVEVMGSIYSLTDRNLIWLGEEDRDTGFAISAIDAIFEDIEHETRDGSSLYDVLYSRTMGREGFDQADGNVPKLSSTDVSVEFDQEALLRFFSSSWFSRLRIGQESSLPPSNVCYKGDFEIPLHRVLRAALWIRYKQRFLPILWNSSTQHASDLADWAEVAGKAEARSKRTAASGQEHV